MKCNSIFLSQNSCSELYINSIDIKERCLFSEVRSAKKLPNAERESSAKKSPAAAF